MKGNLEKYRLPLSYLRIYLIILLYFCLHVRVSTSKYYRIRKCCLSEDKIVDQLKVNCITNFSDIMELYSSSDIKKHLQNYVIPKCKNLKDDDHPVEIYLDGIKPIDLNTSKACLDIIQDESIEKELPVLVHCHLNKNNTRKMTNELSLPITTTIRRCCPRDMIFDPNIRSCILTTELQLPLINNDTTTIDYSQDLFSSSLSIINGIDFVSVGRGPPYNCKNPIFDYLIKSTDVIYENGIFKAMLSSQKGFAKEAIKLKENNACVEITSESMISNSLILRTCHGSQTCLDKPCIIKCCPEDQMYMKGGCFKPNESLKYLEFHKEFSNSTWSENILEKDYGLLINLQNCKRGRYFLGPEDDYIFTSSGRINIINYNLYNSYEYCIDYLYNPIDRSESLKTFLCFGEKVNKICGLRCDINTVLELTSCAFMVITLVVYACLPVLQNLHGKTLMCHVASLFIAFFCLIVLNWITPQKNNEELLQAISCKVLGYAMLFSFLSTFSWLNVMCFDIWWTFGGSRGSTSTRKRRHKKRFLLYCLYAWGLACLITVIVILVDYTKVLPSYLMPKFGVDRCWFTKRKSHSELFFFIGPVTFLLIINVIFFVITSINCNKVKAEIDKVIADPSDARNKRYQADRMRFMINVKLFIVMGISWILEIISYLVNQYTNNWELGEYLFSISDAFNCLQGLAIFILFVLKRRVYHALRKRLKFEDKRSSSNATTAIHDTCRVNKSASNSTLMSTFQVSSTP